MKAVRMKSRMLAVLAVLLVAAMAAALLAQCNWRQVFALANYTKNYNELTTSELDSLSHRTAVADDLPQMTVFVHGLGGRASHWESGADHHFAYEPASMPETLRSYINTLGADCTAEIIVVKPNYELHNCVGEQKTKADAQSDVLPQATTPGQGAGASALREMYKDYSPDEGARGIGIYDCDPEQEYPFIEAVDFNDNDSPDRFALTAADVTKHIIVIFDQWQNMTRESNDFVYAQFEYCMDALAYQYAQLTGTVPTVNLIGHSRGGITAMQYALAHPYNVASLYTMGTPFNGSDFGSVEVGDTHPFLSLAGYSDEYSYVGATDYAPGVLDILNSDLTESYKTFWNTHYQDFYSHIDFNPIGSYVTSGFVFQLLAEYLADKLQNEYQSQEDVYSTFSDDFSELNTWINIAKYTTPLPLICDLAIDAIDCLAGEEVLGPIFSVLSNINFFPTGYSHIGKKTSLEFVVKDDLFIDLDSQIADGYNGANAKVKLFFANDQTGKESVDTYGVAHNLETHNSDIIDYIVHDLDFGVSAGTFSVRYTENGCYITNLNDATATGELVIPATYNGYSVLGVDGLIRDLDMSGEETYHTGITSVKLPSSVQTIGQYAFFGMSNLQSVTFSGQNNIESIGEYAFAYCSNLTGFTFGAGVAFVGQSAFGACESLTSFSLASGNTTYSCTDGVLYSGGGTNLNCFPAGRGGTFTVPDAVISVAAGAFYGNEEITSVALNNVQNVNSYAFAECTNLASITSDNLEFADVGAFQNTAWLNDSTEDVVDLGNVLVRYQGDDTLLQIMDYTSICALAFVNCSNLEKVDFQGGALSYIGGMAFSGCDNLESVTIRNLDRMVTAGGPLFDATSSCTVNVSSAFIDEYKSAWNWEMYNDQIEDLVVTIRFNIDGVLQEYTKEVTWGEVLSDMPVPQKEGYTFLGWYEGDVAEGQQYSNGVVNVKNVDYTLNAIWLATPYAILYDLDGGTNHIDNPTQYTIGQTISLHEPTKLGYDFVGWEMNEAPLEETIFVGQTGNINLKAIWEAKIIAVGFDSRGSTDYPASTVGLTYVTYGATDFSFEVPERIGFRFVGWFYDSVAYTDENGDSVHAWDLSENTILYAEWEAESFKIRYDTETGSIYFSGSDWTDEVVEVTVGMQLENENILEETFQEYYRIQHKILRYFYYFKPNGDRVEFSLNSASMPFLEQASGTVEFYAEYRQEQHTVFFNTGVQGITIYSLVAESGSDITEGIATRAVTRTGYTFGGWKIVSAPYHSELQGTMLGTSMPDCTLQQLDGSCLVEAVWNPVQVTVELDSAGGVAVDAVQIAYGSDYILPVPTKLGYTFIGWFDANGHQYTLETGESLDDLAETELTLLAHWEATEYTIFYSLGGGTNNSANISSYTINTVFTLKSPTRANFRFMGWFTDDEYECQIIQIRNMTGDMWIFAKWEVLYTITINNSASYTYLSGIQNEAIMLPTYTRLGYDGHFRAVSDNSIYQFGAWYTIEGNETLTVIWESNDYTGSCFLRYSQITVTDDGCWENHIDTLNLTRFTGGVSVATLKAQGYVKLHLTIQLDVAEKNDGYQHILIYNSNIESNATLIESKQFEHGPGKVNSNFTTYTFNYTIDLNSVSGNSIFLLYNASGFGNDDWYNKNLKVTCTLTKIA